MTPLCLHVWAAVDGFAEMNPCHVSSGVAEASEGVERKGRPPDLFRAGRDETGQQGRGDLPTKQVWLAHLLVCGVCRGGERSQQPLMNLKGKKDTGGVPGKAAFGQHFLSKKVNVLVKLDLRGQTNGFKGSLEFNLNKHQTKCFDKK